IATRARELESIIILFSLRLSHNNSTTVFWLIFIDDVLHNKKNTSVGAGMLSFGFSYLFCLRKLNLIFFYKNAIDPYF
ncbi:MAG: hypothetical protein ACKO96_32710, partial [Flammeovirgaceae bacterium]